MSTATRADRRGHALTPFVPTRSHPCSHLGATARAVGDRARARDRAPAAPRGRGAVCAEPPRQRGDLWLPEESGSAQNGFAEAIAEVARQLQAEGSAQETLQTMVELAVSTIGGCD